MPPACLHAMNKEDFTFLEYVIIFYQQVFYQLSDHKSANISMWESREFVGLKRSPSLRNNLSKKLADLKHWPAQTSKTFKTSNFLFVTITNKRTIIS